MRQNKHDVHLALHACRYSYRTEASPTELRHSVFTVLGHLLHYTYISEAHKKHAIESSIMFIRCAIQTRFDLKAVIYGDLWNNYM